MMSFVFILDVALFVAMISFNMWNWYLVLTGVSTIEFWSSKHTVRFKNNELERVV